VNTQKLGVLEYCANRKLGVPEVVEDTVSSKVDWRQREIGVLLGSCVAGDVIVISEMSRLARSTLQVLEIMSGLSDLIQRGIDALLAIGFQLVAVGLVFGNHRPERLNGLFIEVFRSLKREIEANHFPARV